MKLESASRWATIVIAFVAVSAALQVGGSIFAPLTFGLVLGVVLSPLADFVDRIGLHRVFSALLSILVAGGLITLVVIYIEPAISQAVRRAPEIMSELGLLLGGLQEVIRGLDNMSEEVSQAINENAAPGANDNGAPVQVPGAFDALTLAPSIIAQLLIVVGAFFFFLISRHEIYEWVARRRDGSSEGPSAVTLKAAERIVARYFLTITVINATLGLLVGIAFYVIGMPSPLAWGLIAATLNYILYIGPAVFAVSALLGGVLAFDGAMGVLPAALYISMNACEGNFITPTLVGKNMQVNPLLIFLSLIFWLWLWGPLGGVVAIPILLYILAIVGGFGMSQTISFGTAGRSRPNRSAGVGS
jgi:predicted PurR-regulated permease PerM